MERRHEHVFNSDHQDVRVPPLGDNADRVRHDRARPGSSRPSTSFHFFDGQQYPTRRFAPPSDKRQMGKDKNAAFARLDPRETK